MEREEEMTTLTGQKRRDGGRKQHRYERAKDRQDEDLDELFALGGEDDVIADGLNTRLDIQDGDVEDFDVFSPQDDENDTTFNEQEHMKIVNEYRQQMMLSNAKKNKKKNKKGQFDFQEENVTSNLAPL